MTEPPPDLHSLTADVWLYPADRGGKKIPMLNGYRCPLFATQDKSRGGWDARFRFEDRHFEPGTKKRVTLDFLSDQGASIIGQAQRFFLWEGRFIGEGIIVNR